MADEKEGAPPRATKTGNYQTVSAKNPKDNRVILWEKDALHPDGEVLIWGDPRLEEQPTFQSGATPTVQKLITDGILTGAGDPMVRK